MRKNDLKNIISKSKDKDNTEINSNNNINKRKNLIGNSNINTNRSYIKTKLVKKNKKVNFSLPINLKGNKLKGINKSIKNNGALIGVNNANNLKNNAIHRHTKSSFIQGTNLLLNKFTKDTNITYINGNLYNNESQQKKINKGKKNPSNNFFEYNTKITSGNKNKKDRNDKIIDNLNKDKIQNIQSKQKNDKKDFIKNDLINSYRESNMSKNSLGQIIEELKSEFRNNSNNQNNIGLTKKFIDAQNNWRRNYFATVIQKLFRGHYFRKNYNNYNLNEKNNTNFVSNLSSNSKNNKNRNINSIIYIKKKAKDASYLSTSSLHNKEFTSKEKNKFIKNNKTPHKIREIIISLKSKKDYFNNNNIYYNNCMIPNIINKQNSYYVKFAFDLWKEKKEKIEILKKLKILKKYKKNLQRKSSYEKKRNNSHYQI